MSAFTPDLTARIERVVTDHLGRPWRSCDVQTLDDRASHPARILDGDGLAVFVKLLDGPDAQEQADAELRGLRLLHDLAGVRVPVPVASGTIAVDGGTGSPTVVLITEAVPERPPHDRTADDWAEFGRALAAVHRIRGEQFGLEWDGFFGPLRQDNRPVYGGWADFYRERRLAPLLRSAVDSRNLPADLAAGVERLMQRLPQLSGAGSEPILLHGDAQQNNILSSNEGDVVLLDACPYYGHPEVDLALIDYFQPVPARVFDAYRELHPIERGFEDRREIWRLHGYLAGVTVDDGSELGRQLLNRIHDLVRLHG